jgi:hypothetical protein
VNESGVSTRYAQSLSLADLLCCLQPIAAPIVASDTAQSLSRRAYPPCVPSEIELTTVEIDHFAPGHVLPSHSPWLGKRRLTGRAAASTPLAFGLMLGDSQYDFG